MSTVGWTDNWQAGLVNYWSETSSETLEVIDSVTTRFVRKLATDLGRDILKFIESGLSLLCWLVLLCCAPLLLCDHVIKDVRKATLQ